MSTADEQLEKLRERLARAEARAQNLEIEVKETLRAAEEGKDLRPHLRRLQHSVDRVSVWSPEKIKQRIADWYDEYGRTPTTADWNPGKAKRERSGDYLAETLDRYYEQEWPNVRTVSTHFPSFNAAIIEAGFEPNEPGLNERSGSNGGRSREDERLPAWEQWHMLATYRDRRGMTQKDLADKIGMSMVHYAHIEQGKHTNPGIRMVLAIAEGLELPPAALVT